MAGSDLNSSTGVQSLIGYTLHHVFEVALKSPNEMLSVTRLAHGRSAIVKAGATGPYPVLLLLDQRRA